MSASDSDSRLRSRKREFRILALSVGSALTVTLAGLIAPRRLILAVLVATIGNLIGLILLSPRADEDPDRASRSRSGRWN